MATIAGDRIHVGNLAGLQQRGTIVLPVAGHGVAVFWHEDRVYALDNRCPHMGFPLNRGTLRDGLLTCHWHHARFDLCSGGTLDPFADDVRSYRVQVEDGEIWLDPRPQPVDEVAHWTHRLEEGLEQQLNLVIAKAVLGLLAAGVSPAEIIAIGGRYGAHYRDAGWGSGMTILTAMANVLPHLAAPERPLALYHGLVRLAEDCAGRPPRFALDPLPAPDVSLERLASWLRRSIQVRDADGSERALQTAIAAGAEPRRLASMLFSAATDHFFLDTGHVLDYINKACEYLDLAGWQEAPSILGSLIPGLVSARRSEELNAWRYPVDLVALVQPVLERLPSLVPPDGRGAQLGEALEPLAWTLLNGEPDAIVDALLDSLGRGIAVAELGQAVAYAAALRLARFHTSNEFGDWDTVHNTWTSCHALHRALLRAPSAELARGLFHAAMQIYLDRFLNIPAARLPDIVAPDRAAGEAQSLPAGLLDLMDREQQVGPVAELIDACLGGSDDPAALLQRMGEAVLREDAGFHMYQTLEAGISEFESLLGPDPRAARRVMVGVGRYLAAHAPTQRAMKQTAMIAGRLQRGEELFAEEEA